eukprot:3996681-Amphidinium_carterae.1
MWGFGCGLREPVIIAVAYLTSASEERDRALGLMLESNLLVTASQKLIPRIKCTTSVDEVIKKKPPPVPEHAMFGPMPEWGRSRMRVRRRGSAISRADGLGA